MNVYEVIKKDRQIRKFCFYGFFKNLRFFEPYLYIYILNMGLGLFDIGVLVAIREVMTYLFEVPSGIIADSYGKKKELMMCFVFYIVSFCFFFIGGNMAVLSIGMVFYGLGEAFRSGTHKGMILDYLEKKEWFEYKGFVYGRTRSYSLVGSSVSSFIAILLIFNVPTLRWIFLVSIVPYILDFLLIASYPSYLDKGYGVYNRGEDIRKFGLKQIRALWKNRDIKRVIISSASFDGIFKTIKDYIQPILGSIIIVAGVNNLNNLSQDDSVNVYLGVIYGVVYLLGSFVSRNIFKITGKQQAEKVFNKMYDIMGIVFIVISFAIHKEWVAIGIGAYIVLFLLKDGRRAVFLDVSADYIPKEQRVTTLSVESQVRAILMVFMAPLFGWIADSFSIAVLFLGIGCFLLIANRWIVKGYKS